ncbi:type IA DNA topoisomerase [Desulfocicer vacuolatum]|nr:type IA DNA topoisomerase [Desulfocicer vacuolatum]
MTELILTEKHSVAADFAKALGVKTKKDGFFEGENYVITWAVGHLVELYAPDDYDPGLKKWRMETLPLIPDTFKYKPMGKTLKQFKTIKNLVKQSRFSRIIIATDAGREGEVIARTILLQSGVVDKERMVRFWTSQALVPKVVRATMEQLQPLTHYDRLWRAGYYRQVADWLVGMNLTRALTVRLGDLFSVGRVQTAVLALLAQRKQERETFVPELFWLIKIRFKSDKGEWTGHWFKNKQTRITQKETARTLHQHLKQETDPGTVLSLTKEKKKEPPPLLFSLTDLQQEANARMGFPAKKTLAVAQSLYQDKKCLSYPRTDSRVLGTTSLNLVRDILAKCQTAYPDIFAGVDPQQVALSNKRVFNDARLTDHHALIPFKPIPAGATPDEKKIFDLVCRRFAAAFHPHCHFENTHLITEFGKETFQTRGKVILEPGWRRVYHIKSRNKDEAEPIPPLCKGDTGTPEKILCEEKKTTPPPDYSDALLLKDMTNPGRYVAEENIKKLYRGEIGIGTQSTRAQIIETLIRRNYIERTGKRLVATDKGIYLIEQLKKCATSSVLTSPEETARWEMKLNAIALGEAPDGQFLKEIKTFVTQAVGELQTKVFDIKKFSQALSRANAKEVGKCPACGNSVRELPKLYACDGTGCDFVIWKRMAGKQISPKMASNLLKFRKSGPFKGFISKKKKRFSAGLVINKVDGKWKVNFDFNTSKAPDTCPPESPLHVAMDMGIMDMNETPFKTPPALSHEPSSSGTPDKKGCCPMCKGKIIEGKTAFGCSNWRPEHGNCRFVIWKEILGKRLTEKNIETLLQGKKTRAYVFKPLKGEKFKAALKMVATHGNAFAIQILPADIKNNTLHTQIPCLR